MKRLTEKKKFKDLSYDESKKDDQSAARKASLSAPICSEQRAYGLVNRPDQAMRWLERLTPGGSEFHGEPENCFNHVIRERDARWETIKRQQRRIRELEALLSPNAPFTGLVPCNGLLCFTED